MSVINLTTENFEEEVLNAKEPVLVDFLGNMVVDHARQWDRLLMNSHRSLQM